MFQISFSCYSTVTLRLQRFLILTLINKILINYQSVSWLWLNNATTILISLNHNNVNLSAIFSPQGDSCKLQKIDLNSPKPTGQENLKIKYYQAAGCFPTSQFPQRGTYKAWALVTSSIILSRFEGKKTLYLQNQLQQ